jgi:glucose-1-phosphate cytidylyltransferase
VLALGYRASSVKHYFLHFDAWRNDFTVGGNKAPVIAGVPPVWTIHLVDTGLHTATGGRLRRTAPWLEGDECFFLAYCDVLADVDFPSLLAFHRSHGRLVTVAAATEPERFGRIRWREDRVEEFREKGNGEPGWINCGFFVVDRRAISLIDNDAVSWEADVLPRLASQGELMGFRHTGFFAPVDTPEERDAAESLCAGGAPPWRRKPT